MALWALLLAAAPLRAEVPKDAAAVVNGRAIPLSEYREERAAGSGGDALDYLIETELLAQQGEREGLAVTPDELDAAELEVRDKLKGSEGLKAMLGRRGIDEKRFRAELARRALARKVVERDVRSKLAPPTDAELRSYFSRIQSYLARPTASAPKGADERDFQALREEAARVEAFSAASVRLSRILFRVSYDATAAERRAALDKARDAKWALDRGQDFGAVARARSEDERSAPRGGDLGFFLRGALAPEVAAEAFSLGVGQASDPILTGSGYELIRVTDKRAARAPDFERFKDDLARSLSALAFDKAYAAYLKGLYDKAAVERRRD